MNKTITSLILLSSLLIGCKSNIGDDSHIPSAANETSSESSSTSTTPATEEAETIATVEPVTFDPAPGEYTESQFVTLDLPKYSAIYVTTDGVKPSTQCVAYDGSPIEISSSAMIQVLYIVDGQEYRSEGNYTITSSQDTNSAEVTNTEMLNAWLEYETAIRQELMDKNNGGAEPGYSSLGKLWTINDGVGGTIEWITNLVGISAVSTITLKNYEFNGLRVSGKIIGTFDFSGSGTTETEDQGETLILSGIFNGSIENHLIVAQKATTGGHYTTQCADAGCAAGTVNYAAPNWTQTGAGSTVSSTALTCQGM